MSSDIRRYLPEKRLPLPESAILLPYRDNVRITLGILYVDSLWTHGYAQAKDLGKDPESWYPIMDDGIKVYRFQLWQEAQAYEASTDYAVEIAKESSLWLC